MFQLSKARCRSWLVLVLEVRGPAFVDPSEYCLCSVRVLFCFDSRYVLLIIFVVRLHERICFFCLLCSLCGDLQSFTALYSLIDFEVWIL